MLERSLMLAVVDVMVVAVVIVCALVVAPTMLAARLLSDSAQWALAKFLEWMR